MYNWTSKDNHRTSRHPRPPPSLRHLTFDPPTHPHLRRSAQLQRRDPQELDRDMEAKQGAHAELEPGRSEAEILCRGTRSRDFEGARGRGEGLYRGGGRGGWWQWVHEGWWEAASSSLVFGENWGTWVGWEYSRLRGGWSHDMISRGKSNWDWKCRRLRRSWLMIVLELEYHLLLII